MVAGLFLGPGDHLVDFRSLASAALAPGKENDWICDDRLAELSVLWMLALAD